MPTYQYACTACDHRFEAVQSFSDASLTDCPACSGALRKVFSSVGIVFKGSGFYRTDSRNGASGATAAKAESGAAKGESSGSSDNGSAGSSGGESGKSNNSGGSKDSGSKSSSTSSSSTPSAAAS